MAQAVSLPAGAVWERFDWYESPLYYDIIFAEETEQEAQWLHLIYGLYGPLPSPSPSLFNLSSSLRVLEPACGSGRLMRALQRFGYRCTGFDAAAGAVRFAQQRAEAEQTVFQADLSSFSISHPELAPAASFHLAHCLVSSLKYVLCPRALLQHFRSVHTVLAEGGLYVLSLHLTDWEDDGEQADCSIDYWDGHRDGLHVAASISCTRWSRADRTEKIEVKMQITDTMQETKLDAKAMQEQTEGAASLPSRSRFLVREETMRTYDRQQVWQLLCELQDCFELLATFDYAHVSQLRIDSPLDWPHWLQQQQTEQTADARGKAAVEHRQDKEESSGPWPGWSGVEAVALVLRKR